MDYRKLIPPEAGHRATRESVRLDAHGRPMRDDPSRGDAGRESLGAADHHSQTNHGETIMNIIAENIERHRNGICGAPFHVLIFRDPEEGGMLGVVFDSPGHVAVFNLDKLACGSIAFGVNSWRGDRYEPTLRAAIARWAREEQCHG
ncbi:hypothetical protein [Tautonia rosea]|uniref:hypothetical protein n=1 Tax=Tautonia rosea TaxID=2728037 RepID=UPI001474B7DC|nr:hypothetical protein [Tautonia rosea]